MNKQLYVPILKWCKGEQEALKNLTSEQKLKIIPLLEITDIVEPSIFIRHLKDCFNGLVYIDTYIAAEDDRDYLLSLISELSDNNVEAVPILYYEDLALNFKLFISSVNRFAIRIPVPGEIDTPEYKDIFNQIESLKSENLQFDIILDLSTISDGREARNQYMEVREILESNFIGKSFYSSIIIAATSFPENLSKLEAGNDLEIKRYDFMIYKKLLETDSIKSLLPNLIYSDYGVTKFTDFDIDFKYLRYGVLPKVKYTTEESYKILKGKKDRATRTMIRGYKDLAKEVCNSDYYYGENFSFGDLEIKERAYALNKKGTGNSTNWVTIAANHHIAVLVEQLSNIL